MISKQKIAIVALSLLVAGLGTALLFVAKDRLDLSQTNDKEVRAFYVRASQGKVGFTDANELIFPDDKKFLDAKQAYIKDAVDFIAVDLRSMKLTLYKAGTPTEELKVLTKGREGSWWETPTGNYHVLEMEQNHFSTIGKVWMPWSIQFYGNFFIHGWPYHEDGSPVSSTFTGGCIRLATEDAKKVYEFAAKGMPILVRDQEPPVRYASFPEKEVPPPEVGAHAFLVANLSTGETLLEKRASEPHAIASLTKLMTGVVGSELVYLERSIKVTDSLLAAASVSFNPVAGDRYRAFDLLYPLLMQSSNKAANILAGFSGRAEFVANMNSKARSIEMQDTTFADPSGISAGNISTPKDVLTLLQYIYYKRRFLFDITKGKSYDTFGSTNFGELKNFNEFVSDVRLIGLKNGKTRAAGETIAGVWEFETPEGKVPVAIITLGSTDRKADAAALLAWTEAHMESR